MTEKQHLSQKIELMDWKEIERGAAAAIHNAKRDITIAEILGHNAKSHIKVLGGKTIEDEEEEAKQRRKEAEQYDAEHTA